MTKSELFYRRDRLLMSEYISARAGNQSRHTSSHRDEVPWIDQPHLHQADNLPPQKNFPMLRSSVLEFLVKNMFVEINT